MENTFENALKFVRTLDERGSEWSESEKTLAAAMVDYHNEVVNKNALLADASCRFSDADVRNIVLEMQNAAMQAHSHNLSRFETRVELQKVKKRWNL